MDSQALVILPTDRSAGKHIGRLLKLKEIIWVFKDMFDINE
jgi:hypothetical protein